MKHVAQRPRDGRIDIVDAPLPVCRPGWVIVENRYSLISAGTERSRMQLASKNLVQKARARPDLVRKVVDRARTEGIGSTVAAARERLDAATPLGYSSAGVVLRVGEGVGGLAPGDHVACAGGGWANHAEVIAVPRNLVAKVPPGVPLDSAAYATVGAIALHGVRQADAVIGERIGVIGLGLVGQLAVRILVAAGCEVFGFDVDPGAVELSAAVGARAFARDEPALEATVAEATGGLGLDAVLVSAATKSTDPLDLAAHLARDRGRLVVLGDVPVAADRTLMYEKELELRLSRSYGPGRYDRDYEEHGRDLPVGYVRWTEGRNLQAFVALVASGKVDPSPLTTHRFAVDDAAAAYAALAGDAGGPRPFGVLLEYPPREQIAESVSPPRVPTKRPRKDAVGIGLIGAGGFARITLLPRLREEGARLVSVATEGGLSAADVAARFGFEHAASSPDEILADDAIDAVVIATRHASHAELAAAALNAGKAVFVEKPLALHSDELALVAEATEKGGVLMVGFNRRFAPLVERLRRELGQIDDRVLLARVNAGHLAPDHWTHDPEVGGGRLLGEGCHFVDLLSDLAASPIVDVHATAVPQPERPLDCSDSIVATLRCASGAVATLVYTGGGDARLPKERVECFGGGLAAVLDDFRRLELYRNGRRTVVKSRQDKGHGAELACFLSAVAGRGEAPPVGSYLASTRATLAIAESLRTGSPVAVEAL